MGKAKTKFWIRNNRPYTSPPSLDVGDTKTLAIVVITVLSDACLEAISYFENPPSTKRSVIKLEDANEAMKYIKKFFKEALEAEASAFLL